MNTARLCDQCRGAGSVPSAQAITCGICEGSGEIHAVRRSLFGQVIIAQPCTVCHGNGEIGIDSCDMCAGDGRVRVRRMIVIRFPCGVGDGMRMRLFEQGDVGMGGGPVGDLYVEVEESPHPAFVRRGDDLYCRVRIPMTTAALGAAVLIETLVDGKHGLRLESGTQPDTELILRGKGMPRLRPNGHLEDRGDLHVRIDVIIPTDLGTDQRWVLRKLAQIRHDDPWNATF